MPTRKNHLIRHGDVEETLTHGPKGKDVVMVRIVNKSK